MNTSGSVGLVHGEVWSDNLKKKENLKFKKDNLVRQFLKKIKFKI